MKKVILLLAVALAACCPLKKARAGDRDTARAIVIGAEILGAAIASRRSYRQNNYYGYPDPYVVYPAPYPPAAYPIIPRYPYDAYRPYEDPYGTYYRGDRGELHYRGNKRYQEYYDPGYRYRGGYRHGDNRFDPRWRRR
jgi:hypothetical protein